MKDITGYEGLYAITEDGSVWSYPRVWTVGVNGAQRKHAGKWLKTSHMKIGYDSVYLSANNTGKQLYVHRLIAQTYITNHDNLKYINHKDGNKRNNAIDNLEWCSAKDNIRHAFATGLSKGRTPKHNSICHCYKCVVGPRLAKKLSRQAKETSK